MRAPYAHTLWFLLIPYYFLLFSINPYFSLLIPVRKTRVLAWSHMFDCKFGLSMPNWKHYQLERSAGSAGHWNTTGHFFGKIYCGPSPGGVPQKGTNKEYKNLFTDFFSKMSGSKTYVFDFSRGSWRVLGRSGGLVGTISTYPGT